MEGLVKLKSDLLSSRADENIPYHQKPKQAATMVVEDILQRKSFYFQQRTGKLDLRAIGRVDIDRVVKEVDIETLQEHLENVTFADITEDDLRMYSDACFLNLFRLSQLLLEYLLSVQDTLAKSLETLAAKFASTRQMVDSGKADFHRVSQQIRALKREVRQKRATISRYEQLLAIPPPSGPVVAGKCGGKDKYGDDLHSCLSCGKLFTTKEFLQQHILRKHCRRAEQTEPSSEEVTETAGKEQSELKKVSQMSLRLFVQTSCGKCFDVMVEQWNRISQLREHINAAAGYVAAGLSKRLVYRGVHLHDDQTLVECGIPNEGQLVIVDNPPLDEACSQTHVKAGVTPMGTLGAMGESTASEQMSNLLVLLKQQMEWTMRAEECRREQGIGVAEALETRMRQMEASLPRRLEDFMEESVGGLKSSFRKTLDDMELLHRKKSNAGPLVDDDEEARKTEAEKMTSLSAEVDRISKQNLDLVSELSKIRALHAPASSDIRPASASKTAPVSYAQQITLEENVQEETVQEVRGVDLHKNVKMDMPDSSKGASGQRSASSWDLTFPKDGERPAVSVQVSRTSTCEMVCEAIACILDVAEQRVVLKERQSGGAIPFDTPSAELEDLEERGVLQLEVLGGTLVSDSVVDDFVDFYEKQVPIAARDSDVISKSLAEVELVAERRGADGSKKIGLLDRGMMSTEMGEMQVQGICAELCSTLTASEVASGDLQRANVGTNASEFTKAFGLIEGCKAGEESTGPTLVELRGAVQRRQLATPNGIKQQMEHVARSVQDQLSSLLEEAEDKLEQLQEESEGDDTYSTTDGTSFDHEERGESGRQTNYCPGRR